MRRRRKYIPELAGLGAANYTKKIPDNILDIIRNNCEVKGNKLYITKQLDRKDYTDLNKILTKNGGKWNRKEQAIVFDKDITELFENLSESGTWTDNKKKCQFFATPDSLAKRLVEMADIQPGDRCLEPSAGRGAIAKYMREKTDSLDCIELDPENKKYLQAEGYNVVADDFLNFKPSRPYDVIVMNPPFSNGQDAEHVTHAFEIARRVVAIVSPGFMFRQDKTYKAFHDLIEKYGDYEELEQGTFKESGTNVKTYIVRLANPEIAKKIANERLKIPRLVSQLAKLCRQLKAANQELKAK